MPVIQWLAVELAIEQGLNPDHPRNLDTVVRLALSQWLAKTEAGRLPRNASAHRKVT
jgi:hypothetical protein